MKTMTLNLGDKEMAYLEKVAASKEMTKTNIMRNALYIYQLYDSGHLEHKPRSDLKKNALGFDIPQTREDLK